MKMLTCRLVLIASLLLVQSVFAQRISPNDFEYRGAFKLPEGTGGSNWEYAGYGMTFYPGGDKNGAADGYPGSLFAIGHDHQQFVSEISIPKPVISNAKSLDDLHTARTLQPFHDITHGMFGELEIPRADLAYLPATGSQQQDKLYFCWGQHFQFELQPSHGACNLDLSNPQTAGPWYFGDFSNYVTNDYMFELPADWAARTTPGARLVCGRFRDGGWGGHGPTLFAFDPWINGSQPQANAVLNNITPLLMYGIPQAGAAELAVSDSMKMNGYTEADEWSGGAWLTTGQNAAVAFVGTKGLGNYWYGFSNGVVWPFDGPYPEVPEFPHDDRGWWSDSIQAQIVLYDPAELADVANGNIATWAPQPYATLNLDPWMFAPGFDLWNYKRYTVGACAFDRENSLLYVFERMVQDGQCIIHVWHIQTHSLGIKMENELQRFEVNLQQNFPNPCAGTTKIRYTVSQAQNIKLQLFDLRGRQISTFYSGEQHAGQHEILVNLRGRSGMKLPAGVYFLHLSGCKNSQLRKIVVLD